MANGNGNGNGYAKRAFWLVITAAISLLSGAVAGGAYMGGQAATISGHIANPAIHETAKQKEDRIRGILDREVMPQLEQMRKQLDRIERKIDRQ